MSQTVEIDEVDIKILRELIKDARTKLKDIAKKCGLSSNAIFKRVKRLKTAGVITGTILYIDLKLFGYEYPATIGINLKANQYSHVSKLIRKHAILIALNPSFGRYDLCAFVVAKSIEQLENLKENIRKQQGVRRIAVNFWDKPYFNFENIDLQPKRAE
jgi:Lrp/AsnC family transcriptional regulator for asnA, asnC and gidA